MLCHLFYNMLWHLSLTIFLNSQKQQLEVASLQPFTVLKFMTPHSHQKSVEECKPQYEHQLHKYINLPNSVPTPTYHNNAAAAALTSPPVVTRPKKKHKRKKINCVSIWQRKWQPSSTALSLSKSQAIPVLVKSENGMFQCNLFITNILCH